MKSRLVFICLMLIFPIALFANENSKSLVQMPPSRQTQFAMGHFGFSLYPDCSFGITYGQVKSLGWYVNAMTDFGTKFSCDITADENGCVEGDYLLYTGEKKSTYLSVTVGGIANIQIPQYSQLPPMYLFGGIGYGYRAVFYELSDSRLSGWETSSSPREGLHWELGGMCNINNIAISLAVSSVTNFKKSNFFETKLGVGYFFK